MRRLLSALSVSIALAMPAALTAEQQAAKAAVAKNRRLEPRGVIPI